MSSSYNLNIASKIQFNPNTNFQDYEEAAKIIREQDLIIKRLSTLLNQIDIIISFDSSIEIDSPTFKKISEHCQFICEISEYCQT